MQIGVVPLHCLCSNHSTYIFGPTCSLHLQRILTQTNFWRCCLISLGLKSFYQSARSWFFYYTCKDKLISYCAKARRWLIFFMTTKSLWQWIFKQNHEFDTSMASENCENLGITVFGSKNDQFRGIYIFFCLLLMGNQVENFLMY